MIVLRNISVTHNQLILFNQVIWENLYFFAPDSWIRTKQKISYSHEFAVTKENAETHWYYGEYDVRRASPFFGSVSDLKKNRP